MYVGRGCEGGGEGKFGECVKMLKFVAAHDDLNSPSYTQEY